MTDAKQTASVHRHVPSEDVIRRTKIMAARITPKLQEMLLCNQEKAIGDGNLV